MKRQIAYVKTDKIDLVCLVEGDSAGKTRVRLLDGHESFDIETSRLEKLNQVEFPDEMHVDLSKLDDQRTFNWDELKETRTRSAQPKLSREKLDRLAELLDAYAKKGESQ